MRKIAALAILGLGLAAPLAMADTATTPGVKLSDSQLDSIVGGWCEAYFPDMTFEGQPVYEVAHGEGAIVCALKPNGGIPLVIFTGHNGSGQIVVIGDQGTAR